MRLRKLRPLSGIRFAWLPVWTDEGLVWLEDVHYHWSNAEFGGYHYNRVHHTTDRFGLPKVDYSRWDHKVPCDKLPIDPPDCRYPRCTCMLIGGSSCSAERP